jgi:GntR family transcriptional regulator
MLFRVDPLSPEPIFKQLVYQVKAAVARGELISGDRLPSVRELAREVAVNPNTVTRAYGELESQGAIVRRQGSGCFVTSNAGALDKGRRTARLDDLVDRTITEAFHLGCASGDVRAAVERRLAALSKKEAQ